MEVEVLRGDRRRGRVHAGTHQVACNRVCVSRGRIVYKPRRGELEEPKDQAALCEGIRSMETYVAGRE